MAIVIIVCRKKGEKACDKTYTKIFNKAMRKNENERRKKKSKFWIAATQKRLLVIMKGLHPIWGELKISIKTSIKNKKIFFPNCVRYFSALTKLINSSHFTQINIWATVLNQKAFHLIAQNSAGNYRRNGYKIILFIYRIWI